MVRFRTPDGITVSAYDLGGDGLPLLFAHATGFHGRIWLPLAERLRKRFHCYAFDSRGHGDSDPAPGGDYDWTGFAADALAVVDGFGLTRPFAVGHSAGGALLLLAEEDRPGTFAGMVLYEPIAAVTDQPPPPGSGGLLSLGARKRRAEFPSRDAAFDNYKGKGPFASFTDDALRAYVEHGFADTPDGSVKLKCEPEQEARTYEMAMSHRAYGRLDAVRCPVTFLAGEIAPAMALPALEAMATRLGDRGIAIELDGLDHFGPMADPDRIAAIVEAAFLSE